MARRRGFWVEFDAVFNAAHDMVGGTYPPEEMGEARKRIESLKRELTAKEKKR